MADGEIASYLRSLPRPRRGICRKLYKLARAEMPAAHAMMYHGVIGFSTTESGYDRFVYIAPQRSWVNLGFFFGIGIPDPQKLLVGEGKRMRHIKIRDGQEANRPELKRILRAAMKKAPKDIATIHRKQKNPRKA